MISNQVSNWRSQITKFDWFIFSCLIVGVIPPALILLGLVTLARLQLTDLGSFINAISDPSVFEALFFTFSASLCATSLLFLTGTPLAWILSRYKFPGKLLLEGMIDLPLVLPHTVAGIIVYLLFMRHGPLGRPFSIISIQFEEAFLGVVVAMYFVMIPYFVDSVREGFTQISIRYEHVARSLGASPFRAFMHVTMPLARRHLISGSVLAFGRGVSEFAAVVMIAYHPMIISTLIYQRFSTGGLSEATAVAFVMVIISLLIFILIRYIGGSLHWRYHD